MKKLRKILNEMILEANDMYPTEVSEEMLNSLINDLGFSQTEADDFAKKYNTILKEIKYPLIDDDVSPSELLEIFDSMLPHEGDTDALVSSVEIMTVTVPQSIMTNVLAFLGDVKEEDDEDVYKYKLVKGSSALYDIFEIVGMTPSCVRVRAELERIIRPLGFKSPE